VHQYDLQPENPQALVLQKCGCPHENLRTRDQRISLKDHIVTRKLYAGRRSQDMNLDITG